MENQNKEKMLFLQQVQVIKEKQTRVPENSVRQILAILTLCLDLNKELEILQPGYNDQVVEQHLQFSNLEQLLNHNKFWMMEAK